MPIYIINKDTHQVHIKKGCNTQPEGNNWETIVGNPKTLAKAVLEAQKKFPNADRCENCHKKEQM